MKWIRLPDAELEVMKAVWSLEPPAATTEVKTVLERQRPWNASALLTLLNRLIARGFLRSEKQGKNRYYEPLVSEADYLAFENRSFLQKLNRSSVTRMVASLYDSHSITEADLEELAAFIQEKTGGKEDA